MELQDFVNMTLDSLNGGLLNAEEQFEAELRSLSQSCPRRYITCLTMIEDYIWKTSLESCGWGEIYDLRLYLQVLELAWGQRRVLERKKKKVYFLKYSNFIVYNNIPFDP